MPELRDQSSSYGLVVTVQTMAPGHVVHDAEAVHELLVERLPGAVQQLVKTAAPEVFVTVVGVQLEEVESDG
jgi:hypothetical protein